MMPIESESINEIRAKVDIVEIISSYINLTARGKNYFGICPFHDDNHPSMSVSREKQIYTCFSCGASGNVFKFVMDYEHVSYIESISIVAKHAGININIKNHDHSITNKNKELYEMYDLARKVYQNNLNTKDGIQAKEYLHKRDISDEAIKYFEIGLALKNNRILTDLFIKKKYSQELMLKSGLIIKNEKGPSDIYYNRIMFPLYDLSGQAVAFSGRIYLDSKDTSKYINSRETDIFKKGELLYNYHHAREEARIKDTIIVVEGFMDVIRLFMVGIKNVVATMGTAVTRVQANLIKRMAKNVILCFDGDEAGSKAIISCADELSKIGVIPRAIALPENLDPDEYIIKYGRESYQSLLDNPLNIMDFRLMKSKKKYDLSNTTEAALYVNSAIDDLKKIDDDVIIEITLKKLANEVGIDYEFLKNKLNSQLEKKEVKVVPNKKNDKKINQVDVATNSLIYYMLYSKEAIKLFKKSKVYIGDDNKRLLCRQIVGFYDEYNKIEIADFISTISDSEELMKTLGDILILNLKSEFDIAEINDYIELIKKYNIDVYCNKLKEDMRRETDVEKKTLIAKKIFELKQGDVSRG